MSGDSGSRTRVQTWNIHAFYTLILASIVGIKQDPSHQLYPYLLNFRPSIAACSNYLCYFCAA